MKAILRTEHIVLLAGPYHLIVVIVKFVLRYFATAVTE